MTDEACEHRDYSEKNVIGCLQVFSFVTEIVDEELYQTCAFTGGPIMIFRATS